MDNPIANHRDTYLHLLGTGSPVALSVLTPGYRQMSPSLHRHLNDPIIDVSVLSYALTRLPQEYRLAQRLELVTHDPQAIDKRVRASARRRLSYFDPNNNTLTFVITSDSDIDDIVNAAIAVEIEVKKICQALSHQQLSYDTGELQKLFMIDANDLETLQGLMGHDWKNGLASWNVRPDITVTLSKNDPTYQAAFETWMQQLNHNSSFVDLFDVPVYFVSSNTHSLTNIITGYVWQIEAKLFPYIEKKYPKMYRQWEIIRSQGDPARVYDFVYYFSKIYLEDHPADVLMRHQTEAEKGIRRIISTGPFDTVTQIIPINSIPSFLYPDPLLKNLSTDKLRQSRAIIINIEYPLGQSALYLLNTFLQYFKNVKGIYIIGKAAILNGNIGDIQIPNVVMDENNNASFVFDNCFNWVPVTATSVHIHDSQKALSLYGTFLENQSQMEKYQQDGYNVIEMESGSYLASIFGHLKPNIKPLNGTYIIPPTHFDLGIINYASDNPLVSTLGDLPLATRGIEPTYSATAAVIKRIIDLESKA